MNILYLHSHDTGRAIEPYGFKVRTPHLQRLADGGVLFRNAYCAAPTCSPSRAALLTGQYAHETGMLGLAHRGGVLRQPEHHLASFLGSHGYTTALAGLQHLWHGGEVAEGVYHHLPQTPAHDGEATTGNAIRFLENHAGGKPFFLDVGYFETHRTGSRHGFSEEHHQPRDGDGDPSHVLPPEILPNTPEIRRDWLDYIHSVERLDGYYGQVLEALDRSSLAEQTLVLATTDHGVAFPGHKCALTSHGTGVLFILRCPAAFAGGQVSDALVSHLDFFPTVCDLADLPAPPWLRGASLRPLLEKRSTTHHEALFSEVTFHAAFEPKRGIRTQRWNYIRNFAAPHSTILPNCDDSHSKRLLMEAGLRNVQVQREELYDLLFDPAERHNLAGDPERQDILLTMRGRLLGWMEETADPLLSDNPSVLPLPQQTNPWSDDQPDIPPRPWDVSQWGAIDHRP